MEPTPVAEALTYLPAVGYLFVVCGLLWASGKVPTWIHPAALVAGFSVRVAQSGIEGAAYTLGIGLFVFVGLVFIAARTISGPTLFTLVTAVALIPLQGLPGLLVGLFIAAGVATWRTVRGMGRDRVTWLTLDTMNAMGVSPAGFKPPQPSLIPDRATLTDVHEATQEAKGMRMYLAPYLLLGASLAALYAYVAR